MAARTTSSFDGPVQGPSRNPPGGARGTAISTARPAPEQEQGSAEVDQGLRRLLGDWSEQLGAHFG